jgi:hypothetical protein
MSLDLTGDMRPTSSARTAVDSIPSTMSAKTPSSGQSQSLIFMSSGSQSSSGFALCCVIDACDGRTNLFLCRICKATN